MHFSVLKKEKKKKKSQLMASFNVRKYQFIWEVYAVHEINPEKADAPNHLKGSLNTKNF